MSTSPVPTPDPLVATDLTVEMLQKVVPVKLRGSITQSLIDIINTTMSDPQLRENYRDNIISYASVLNEGRFKLEAYLNAVRYCSFKMLGDTNIMSYVKTFPERYQRMLNENLPEKNIAGIVSAYNKTILVNKVMEQTLIPTHIINADMYQSALNRQALLAVNAKSETVRMNANDSIMNQLRPPEIKKIELDVGVKEDSAIKELKEATQKLAAAQKLAIDSGGSSVKEIAHSTILTVEKDDEKVK